MVANNNGTTDLNRRLDAIEFVLAEAHAREVAGGVRELAEADGWEPHEIAAAGAEALRVAREEAQQDRAWRHQGLTDGQIIARQAARAGMTVETYQRRRALVDSLVEQGVPLPEIARRLADEG